MGYPQLDGVLNSVDGDDITVLNEGDRSADLSLGDNMANAESVAPAKGEPLARATACEEGNGENAPSTEAPVCQTGDVVAQTGTHD